MPDLEAEDAVGVVVASVVEVPRDHEELPEFLFQRHSGEQIPDPGLGGKSGIAVRWRDGTLGLGGPDDETERGDDRDNDAQAHAR